MAYRIIWTENAREDLKNIIDYLKREWSVKAAKNFIEKLDFILDILIVSPHIGMKSHKVKSVQQILITKHNKLYYQIKGQDIILLDFFDTRQHPDKSKY